MIRKFWLRDPDVRNGKTDELDLGHPRVLVAFEVMGNDVFFATATSNPKDKFVRKAAHDQVDGAFKSTRRRCCSRMVTPIGYKDEAEAYPALRRDIVLNILHFTRKGTARAIACIWELDKKVSRKDPNFGRKVKK
jgi:hypothetical protein